MPEIISPADGQPYAKVTYLSEPQAMQALERAKGAQSAWRTTPLGERIAVCRRMLDAYRSQLDEHSRAISQMMGKPVAHARGEFEGPMTERVQHLTGIAETALADEVIEDDDRFERFIRREPVGVVLVIAAWNYPLLVPINALCTAVLAGNAVLLKHALQTAMVGDQLADAFRTAGAPDGLVQALVIDHPTAAKVMATGSLGQVAFTGSVRGGREVYRTVAQSSLTRVSLELGGKDGALVLSDCDIEASAASLADGAFFNAGQSCCAIERVYVERSIYPQFRDAFVSHVRALKPGHPLEESTTLGPLVNAKAAAHVANQVQQAVRMGARPLVGPQDFDVPDLSESYVAPSVLEDVNHDMSLMKEETFGPAIGLMVVDDVDQGVTLVNDSRYGLTASVWTQDASRARQIAGRLQAGTVYANRCDYLDPALAWTGIRESGFGTALSRLGFLELTRPKSFHLKKA